MNIRRHPKPVVGDHVLVGEGIHGYVTRIDPDVIWVEVDDDVQIRVSPRAIRRILPPDPSEPTDDTMGPGADLGTGAAARPVLATGYDLADLRIEHRLVTDWAPLKDTP